MAYIGNPPISGNFQVCDAISVVNGQASYTMQVSSANVSPESANHMLVSLNGVLQKPGSSFTISGSTITFASNLATGDVIDFIMLLGNVLDLGVPSDATVTKAKTNFVSSGSGYTGTGLDIKGDGSANGRLGLLCSAGTHGVALESPNHSSAQSYTIQLPSNSPTVDKFIKVTSLTGSGATAIAHTQFADAGGGMFEFISSTDVTSATAQVDFTSLSTDYSDFKLVIQNLHIGNDNQNPELRYFDSSGLIDDSSNYNWVYHGYDTGAKESYAASADRLRLGAPIGNGSHEHANLEITIYDVHETGQATATEGWKMASAEVVYSNAAGEFGRIQSGGWTKQNDGGNYKITGFRFFMSGGNIESGRFSLYGRKHS